MNINDKDFIALHLPKLSETNIINIIINYKLDLDKYGARLEKPNIGTYIYLNKLPDQVLLNIRKSVETYI
jgi:hypothetical protein